MLKFQYTQLQIEVMASYTFDTLQMAREVYLFFLALTSCFVIMSVLFIYLFLHRQLKGES